jgi:hypothetical protein
VKPWCCCAANSLLKLRTVKQSKLWLSHAKPVISFKRVCRLGELWGLGCQEVKIRGHLRLLMLLWLYYLTFTNLYQSLHDGILQSQQLLKAYWRRRWRGWRHRWMECPMTTVWWLGDFIILALSWASLHHLPQGSSYHQNSVKHLSDMYEYINAGKTDEIWTWSITGNYNSFALIRSSSKEKLHRGCSI